ncbi:Protein kinase, ATP binding site-containing protein [Artemisia annua]|uniref:cyclin-dependent kinase n=1 Tax=Artemisia annua TaxID=35608 RepID=A0A2U1QAN4_ARTAN|nr:Protein kinase, ATP binding site-containing protein [Artemisia annua]
MDKYKIIKEVGNGTFGVVWQALNMHNGEVVAIKKMKRKYYSWEECINLREVKSLRKMNHPNIVKLNEVIRENDILYFVFEYMDCCLYDLMKDRVKPFSEAEIRNWCFNVFQGLVYMHQHGYFHRDLKPENFLVSKGVIKIADFGLAREITSQPPYTEYVSTRWYRAPEVLLQFPKYGPAVDLWGMGAIMAELFTLRPLFPGSSEADEIYKICSVIGSPTEFTWREGLERASKIRYQFPEVAGVNLSALIPSASKEAVSLIGALCSWDPCKRPTAVEALQHPFFQSCYYIPPSLRSKAATARMSPSVGLNGRGAIEHNYATGYSVFLPNVKPANNVISSAKVPAFVSTGVHHKMGVNHQSGVTNEKLYQTTAGEPKYQPIGKYNTTGLMEKNAVVYDTADKLAPMTIRSTRVMAPRQQEQRVYIPPPVKAGIRNGRSDLFYVKSRDIQHGNGRAYCSKVAG